MWSCKTKAATIDNKLGFYMGGTHLKTKFRYTEKARAASC